MSDRPPAPLDERRRNWLAECLGCLFSAQDPAHARDGTAEYEMADRPMLAGSQGNAAQADDRPPEVTTRPYSSYPPMAASGPSDTPLAPTEAGDQAEAEADPDGSGRSRAAAARDVSRERSRLQEQLNAWATERDADGGPLAEQSNEQRDVAVLLIMAWVEMEDFATPLNLASLNLTSLPAFLPDTIQTLDVHGNKLTNLPATLPASLQTLNASVNLLRDLPETLPPSLKTLTVSINQLATLPEALPDTIETLEVRGNELTSLPETLPASLQTLDASNNLLESLPETLPSSLHTLNASENTLESLPETLPSSLHTLNASDNVLESLAEALPSWLHTLDVSNNYLERLPERLPPSLQTLDVSHNLLTGLPAILPGSLQILIANANEMTELPATLPASLRKLEVTRNPLRNLSVSVLTRLDPSCIVHLNSNDLSPDARSALRAATNAPDYAGPEISLWIVFDPLLEPEPSPTEAGNQEEARSDSGDSGRPRAAASPDVSLLAEQLRAWATERPAYERQLPDSEIERRDIAERLIMDWVLAKDFAAPLNLASLNLTSLPAFLPDTIQNLDVHGNLLTNLPATLPASLTYLDADENQLTALPATLPASLRRLHVTDNSLRNLSASTLTRLDPHCIVSLSTSALSPETRSELAAAIYEPGYAGPRITGSPPLDPSLQASVEAWLADDQKHAAAKWEDFKHQEGAVEFALFLYGLRGTVNYVGGDPAFRQSVVSWLSQVAQRPGLRQKSFLAAFGATETCEDGVTATWNTMQKTHLAHDVESGLYDDRWEELVPLARGMFRLDALENIAEEKVEVLLRTRYRENPEELDVLDVHLAFPVKLRERLSLPLNTPDMKYFNVANVSEEELDDAVIRVRQEEAAGFADYLSTEWGPWDALVARLAPDEYAKAQDQLIEAMGDEFQNRLTRRLAEIGMTGDADAERLLGPEIRGELARKIKGALTHSLLQDKGLLDLLGSTGGSAG